MPDLKPTVPRYIMTVSCPDTTGVVAAVAGFLASHHGLITEAQHFDDPYSDTSFVRVVFHDNGAGLPPADELDRLFASAVAPRFRMQWQIRQADRRCRTLLAVSRQSHCLNSLLHRWSSRSLPIDIVGVASNHEDLRELVEWHGVPFYHLPIDPSDKAAQEQRLIALFEAAQAE
jgi:formyltetrahydrofolate deformylase